MYLNGMLREKSYILVFTKHYTSVFTKGTLWNKNQRKWWHPRNLQFQLYSTEWPWNVGAKVCISQNSRRSRASTFSSYMAGNSDEKIHKSSRSQTILACVPFQWTILSHIINTFTTIFSSHRIPGHANQHSDSQKIKTAFTKQVQTELQPNIMSSMRGVHVLRSPNLLFILKKTTHHRKLKMQSFLNVITL